MRCAPLVAILLSACGAAAAGGAPPTADDGIEVRLGCTVIRRAEIDAALQRLPEGDSTSRDEVRARLVQRVVVERISRELGVTVEPRQIDDAIASLAAQHGMSTGELLRAAEAQGLDEATYRAQLAEQLLAYHTASLLTDAIDPAVLDAEVAQRMAAGGATEAEVRERVYADLLSRAFADTLERETRTMMSLPTYAGPRGCTEQPPE